MANSSLALAKADLSDIAIVGGHFSWNIWQELPSYQTAHKHNTNVVGKEGGVSKVADSCTVVSTDHPPESEPSNQSCQPKENETIDNSGPNSTPNSNPNPSLGLRSNPVPHSNPSPGLPAVPPCFVAARHPVARAISYYYQRCYDTFGCSGYQRYMDDLSVEELRTLVGNYRHVGAVDPVADEFAMVFAQ